MYLPQCVMHSLLCESASGKMHYRCLVFCRPRRPSSIIASQLPKVLYSVRNL